MARTSKLPLDRRIRWGGLSRAMTGANSGRVTIRQPARHFYDCQPTASFVIHRQFVQEHQHFVQRCFQKMRQFVQ
jgi:hypothetical protein